jgi:hypothetical protein
LLLLSLHVWSRNGTASLCYTNISLKGAALKRSSEKYFHDKVFEPLCGVQKYIFFVHETKVFGCKLILMALQTPFLWCPL